MTNPTPISEIPVSEKNLRLCLDSATFWTDELPRYADRNQNVADRWAIVAGATAAITSLAIWPVLTDNSTTLGRVLVSAAALSGAISSLIPRIRNHAENAGQARELSGRYASLMGQLIDLTEAQDVDTRIARAVVTEFEATKAKKDTLRRLPKRPRVEEERAAAKQPDARAGQASATMRTATV